MLYKTTSLLALAVGLSPFVMAQNTGGVFGPVVNPDHAAAQYRITFDPDSETVSQRIHYEQSLSTHLMWRTVAGFKSEAGSELEFDSVRGELFWELSSDTADYRNGVRFDLVLRDENRPHTLGVNWMHQVSLGENWTARAVVLTSVEAGDRARDGIFLQTRGQLGRKLKSGQSIGLELYNSYGSIEDFSGFEAQPQQIGPYWSVPVTGQWSVLTQVLVGLNEASPDHNLRLWLTRTF